MSRILDYLILLEMIIMLIGMIFKA
ncbi:hypothetical protein CNEO4_1710003 [Clostridium neonatale]|nr:hypothetical protein CNEO4_1710003 [Clostridium neonatale]